MEFEKGLIDADPDGARFFRALMLRFFARHRPDFPDAKLLADLYEETGDQFYYAALAHLILDKLEENLRAERLLRPPYS